MAYQSLIDFKSQTGMNLDDSTITAALASGTAIMQRFILIPRQYKTYVQTNQHVLSRSSPGNPMRIYIGDKNADCQITKDDLLAYEIDSNYTEYPLQSSISTFNNRYGVVNFSINVPTASNRMLIIEYYEAITDLDKILPMMLEVNQLEAVNWIFQKVPFEKLQNGISQWTLNGVTVEFNRQTMQDVMDSNKKRLEELYNLLIPLYTKQTTLQAPAKMTMADFMSTIRFR